MPSLAGLKTWFHYELLLTAFAVIFLVAFFIVNWAIESIGTEILNYLRTLPLASPKFALGITAASLGTILCLIGLAGRYN